MQFDSYKYKLGKLVCFTCMPLSFITSPANSILLWKANNCKNINTNCKNHKLNKDHLLHTYITLTWTQSNCWNKKGTVWFLILVLFLVYLFCFVFKAGPPNDFQVILYLQLLLQSLFIWCHYFKTPFDQNHRFSAARQNPTKITRLNDWPNSVWIMRCVRKVQLHPGALAASWNCRRRWRTRWLADETECRSSRARKMLKMGL